MISPAATLNCLYYHTVGLCFYFLFSNLLFKAGLYQKTVMKLFVTIFLICPSCRDFRLIGLKHKISNAWVENACYPLKRNFSVFTPQRIKISNSCVHVECVPPQSKSNPKISVCGLTVWPLLESHDSCHFLPNPDENSACWDISLEYERRN